MAQNIERTGSNKPIEPNERQALLRLHLERGVSLVAARQLFDAFDAPSQIFTQRASRLAQWLPQAVAQRLCRAPTPTVARATEAALDWAKQPGCQYLTWLDRAYPVALRDLSDAPPVLYAKGNVGVLQAPAVAVVGSRAATPSGHRVAFGLAQALARANWTVVSGLAVGIDASAHRGALSVAAQTGRGPTVAVMGTAPNQVYPVQHKALADAIVSRGGLLLSEFALGTPTAPSHFPRRNRLVAALGRATVVVQAQSRSGSLITARFANELGRDVFAVPGSAGNPLSAGCHELIRQGAGLLEGVDDLWRAFGLSALIK